MEGRPNFRNIVTRVGLTASILVGPTVVAEVIDMPQAVAWEAAGSGQAHCEPNGGNGDAIAELIFNNQEQSDMYWADEVQVDRNTMLVTPIITESDGTVVTGDTEAVQPGNDPETGEGKWNVSEGSAPQGEATVSFEMRWQNRHDSSIDNITAPINAVDICPPETTTTESTTTTTSTTTTSTTTPRTTTTTTSTTTPRTTSTTTPPQTTTATTTPNTLAETGPGQKDLKNKGLSTALAGLGVLLLSGTLGRRRRLGRS